MNYEEEIARILEQSAQKDWQALAYRGDRRKYAKALLKSSKQILSLFPEGLLKLLDDAKCSECRGKKYIERDRGVTDWSSGECDTCKGTGQRYGIGLIDTNAELPSDRGVNIPFKADPELSMPAQRQVADTAIMAYKQAEQDILKANFHKVVKRL